ncbi:MAG: hypothetical protein H7Z14_02245, partial [Anaerolineae bacterium]|nr:hypothetical protein [Phycisphaerae bacterium]
MNEIEVLEHRLLMSAIHVNAGGGALIDARGRAFSADAGFTGGSVVQVAPYDVARTTNDLLFHSQREGGSFSFAQSVDNGRYALFLEFADAASTAPGQRVFNVSVEGNPEVSNYDIFAKVGQGAADARCVDVTIADGQLNVAFQASAGLACVSAIVLAPTDMPASAQPYSWDGLSETARTTTSASNLADLGSALFFYASENRGNFPNDYTSVQEYFGEYSLHSIFASPRTDTSLPRGELADVERVAWTASRADFLFIHYARLRDLGPNDPWMYENPDRVTDGINVLFGDGRVEHLDRAAAAALIGFPNVPPGDPPVRPNVGPKDSEVTTSQANLLKIGSALRSWSNNNQGRYPTNLGAVFAYSTTGTTLQTFINPRTETTAPPANWTLEQNCVWVATKGDYVYLGNRKSASSFRPYDVLAYERPAGLTGGINVLFGDGRVEFREISWFDETLAHQVPPTSVPPWMSTPGGSYTLSAQSLAINSGIIGLSGDIASINPGMNVTVADGATLVILASQHLGSLVVNGTVELPGQFGITTRMLRVGSLQLGPNGKLDLSDGYLIVDYPTNSPRAMIQAAINRARMDGWLGPTGITTPRAASTLRNTTLGVLEASELRSIYATNPHFHGEPVDDNAVLVQFTYYGDTDFNGVVDFDDYSRIDFGFTN